MKVYHTHRTASEAAESLISGTVDRAWFRSRKTASRVQRLLLRKDKEVRIVEGSILDVQSKTLHTVWWVIVGRRTPDPTSALLHLKAVA